MADLDAPSNPTTLTALSEDGGDAITTDIWYNHVGPYFSWSGASDDDSGVAGYYVYFGTDSGANPITAGIYQAGSTYTASSLINNNTYYLRIRTVDVAGNIVTSTWVPFNYLYDSGEPYNPSKPAVLPAGYTSTNSFRFIWQDNGSDDESGLWGYCYKTGTTDDQSIYYTDQCLQDTEIDSIPAYQNGINVFYLRSIDIAGNKNSQYKEVNYYYNTDSPTEPRNVTVTQASSIQETNCISLANCFEVTWDEPASYSGSIDSYYYSVNEEPTVDDSTETTQTETTNRSLSARPLATQQGTNTFYIVAMDNTNNIEWGLYGDTNFSATTTAPGIPTNMQITDSSNREANQYQLTITWDTPTSVGSGIDHYNIYRSTDNVTFTEISTTLGSATGYLDTGLDNQTRYYYKITAEDNAEAEGSFSTVVNGIPTGRYTTAPNIVVEPSVEEAILSATVSWQMERTCQGYVQTRESQPESYSEQGAGTSAIEHSVTVVGLTADTSYYYRIRCTDIDGNNAYSDEDTFTTNDAPSAPINLTATPASNTQNSFAFSWNSPSDIGVTIDYYYYSVNQEPTESNITRVDDNELDAGPFATQQGVNTFYVVAVDTFGNYSLSNYASVDFTATTTAPGIPVIVSITDSSNRSEERYSLTVEWSPPVQGNVDHYDMYRSTDNKSFEVMSETTSTIYAETGLDTNNTYYYYVKAVDNAEAASVKSSTASKQPTGRYITPPTYTSEPTVMNTSSSAIISWTTNRVSSSFVNYGDTSSLRESKGSLEEETAHEVELTGLNSSTTYYYRVQSFDESRDYALEDALSELFTFTTSVAPAISDVKIEDMRQTSALIRWKTTTVSTSLVKYGKTNSYGLQVDNTSTGAITTHTVKLDNLDADSLYHIRISGTDSEGNTLESDDYVFQTPAFPRIFNVTFEPIEEASSATIKVNWETNVETDSIVTYALEGENFLEKASSGMITEHEITISNMKDNAMYQFYTKGRDQYGNIATSNSQIYETPFDTRPPKVTEVELDTAILGTGQEASAQVIVSWKTDEASTSQIEYGQGVGGSSYTNKTLEDGTSTNSHVVIISNLTPSNAYHLRVISKDQSGNTSMSDDYVIITGRAAESVFDLIYINLSEIFGWMEDLGNLTGILGF